MSRIARMARCTAIALCLPATSAFADLTAADVWEDWKTYSASAGYKITAIEAMSGNTLTISDMAATIQVEPETGQGDLTVNMDMLRFVENADGSVSVEMPETATMNVALKPESGEDVNAKITYTQAEPVMIAIGDATQIVYDYTASSVAMMLSNLTVNGVNLGEDTAKMAVTMNDVAYVAKSTTGDLRGIVQDMSASALSYEFNFTDPEGQGLMKLKGAMRGLSFGGSGDLPAATDMQDVNAMLNAGFKFDGMFRSAGGNYDLTFDGPDGSGTVNSESGGAELRVSMAPGGLNYEAAQKDLTMNMLLTELPLPLSFSAANAAMNLMMPVQKSDDEQNFALGLNFSGFTMSDGIWGMFDPTGQLSRAPATAIVDLSGKAKVLFNFLDPAQASVLEQAGAAPGELNALSLEKLELDAAGARLTGSGSLTFDNGDLVTFDGMPRPLGGVDLKLEGGNGLIDKLVGMGLLPEEQAMGARMMMGLFARPVEGAAPDTLESRIEVNEEGHVLANGQRLR